MPISSEGRAFAAQLTRDLAARERLGSGTLCPGVKTWRDACQTLGDSIAAADGPIKAVGILKSARLRLRTIQEQRTCYINLFFTRSRSAFFEIMTYEVAKHPITDEGNAGVLVQNYFFHLQRRGQVTCAYRTVAFLSWHALGRMRERSEIDMMFAATGAVPICGIAGLVMTESSKHVNTEINLAYGDMLCTGVLRSVPNRTVNGQQHHFLFYDVLTVLPFDEALPHRRAQGDSVLEIVRNYVKSSDPNTHGLADAIPVLRFRPTDFISRRISPA
jgi:hypothetical protein